MRRLFSPARALRALLPAGRRQEIPPELWCRAGTLLLLNRSEKMADHELSFLPTACPEKVARQIAWLD